jgi:hypothetical protein
VVGDSHQAARSWRFVAALAALIGGPILLDSLLPLAGVPITVVSGVVTIVALKHLGVLAVMFAPLYALLRRRRRQR